MKEQAILVAVSDGMGRVTKRSEIAEIYGALAVHPASGYGSSYTVTHIQTGYACLPHSVLSAGLTKAKARRIARALAGYDLNFTSIKSRKFKAVARELRAVIEAVR